MTPASMISLELRPQSGAAESEWLHGLVDQSLTLLRDLLTAGGEPERVAVANRPDHGRAILAVDDPDGLARAHSAQVLSRCREIVNHARQQESERKQEMATLIALVREAVITVSAEVGGLQTSVDHS